MKVLIHQHRVYHGDDHAHTGPSGSLREYYAGHNPPPLPHQAPTVWQELCAAANAYFVRRAQAAPPVAPGAYWPGVPAAPATLELVVHRQRVQARS